MIVALMSRTEPLPEEVPRLFGLAGFALLELDRLVAATPEMVAAARRAFGDDFRVKLAASSFDWRRNELVTAVEHRAELLAISRISPVALWDPDAALGSEDRAMLEAAGIPVAREPSLTALTGESLPSLLLGLAARLPRISWDDYFMRIARIVASRGDCLKRRVAALVVKERRIVATGYNGAPRGTRNCCDGGCSRCASFGPSGTNLGECLCSHGEENAIIQAAYHGIGVKGATLYSTSSPCLLCTKMIINAGIAEVVFDAAYPLGERSLELLRESGVKTRQYSR